MTPEYRPLVELSGVAHPVHHSIWEEIVTVAIFKPLKFIEREFGGLCEGHHLVWDRLVQVVVEKHEVEKHVADGWHTDAATALEAANTADVEAQNAALQEQIDDAKKKLDGRTKEAKAAKLAAPDAQVDSASANTSGTADKGE